MSRRGPRSSAGDVVFEEERERGGPPRNRWDRERFDLYTRGGSGGGERDIDIRINERRGSPPSAAPAPRRSVVEEKERFYERDAYSPPRRNYNWEEPTPTEIARTALEPYRKREFIREYEVESPRRPGRPGLLRRQSSLDTFDRRPARYEKEDWRPPSFVPIPLPIRREHRGRYEDLEEVRFRERERDLSPGWEEEYRDVRVRRRGKSRSRRRAESVRSASTSSSSSTDVVSVKSSRTSKSTKTIVPPMLGKKGKTRMPKRLVHKQAIIDMGLPFDEEEHFIIVQRALEKDHIDDVIKRSEGYKDTSKVTYKFEEVRNDGGFEKEEVKEESKTVIDGPPPVFFPPPLPPPPPGAIVIPPPPPPGSIHHSHHSRSRSRATSPATTVRKEFFEEKVEESAPVHTGLEALQISERSERRSDRSIREEIRALEAEREALRFERRADRKLLEADRYEIVERRRPVEEVIRVEKDKRGRLALIKSNH